MHFRVKNTLKNNRYHTLKHPLNIYVKNILYIYIYIYINKN